MLDAVINLKDNFSDTLKNVEKNVGEFQRTYKRTGRDIQRTGRSISSFGSTLTKTLTVPLIGAGAAAIKIGMDFEEAMSEVQAVTGATGQELEQLEQAARDAGSKTSKSATDAADALQYMGLAGWSVKDSMDGLMPVLRLSEAGNIDLGRASDLVTDSMSAMGIEIQDLEGYLDVIAQTARSSNTDIDAMMEAYLGVGGVLRGLDVELDESATALGMLANAGIKGSEAGQSLSAILTNLTSPTGRAKDAIEELGFSAFDSEGNFKGLDTILFELKDSMDGMTTEQKNNYKAMIAGKNHTKGLNALLDGLDDTYDELTDSIGDSNGALDEMAETMKDNLKGTLTEIKSALEEVGLQVYDILKPALEDVVDTVHKFVNVLTKLTPEQKDAIGQFVKFALVIGPAIWTIGKMTSKIGGLVTEFGFLAQRIGNVGFFKAFMTPGVKVALVLAAIAGVAYIVYKNWDKIKPVVDKVIRAFKDFWEKSQPVVEWLKETAVKAFELLKESVVKLGEGFKNLWDKLKPLATWVKEELIEAFETFKERLNSLKEYIEPLKEKFDEFKEALIPLKEEFNKLKEEFETLQPVLEVLLGFVAGVFAVGFVGTFYTLIELVSGAIESMIIIFGGLLEYLSGIITFLTGVFTGDWEMAWEGLQSIISGFVEIVSGLWNGLITLLTAPIDAVVNLIDNNFGDKAQNIIDWWSKVKEFLKNPIKGVVNLFQNNNNSGKQRGSSSGRQRGGNVGSNYKGTNFWRGGLTEIHERGAEIIDLPRGTRIYPHDKSLQMAIEQGRAEAQNRNALDKVIPFEVPKVTDDVQNVKQNVIPITSIERPDQTGFDLGRLETQNQNIVQTVIPLNIPDVPDKIQNIKQRLIPADVPNVIDTTGNNQTIIPINDVPEENKKETKGKKRTIYIEKLAETVVVREDADVDRIVDKLVSKLEEAAFNTA